MLYGSESNGVTRRDDFWSQGSRDIKGNHQAFDNFGLAVAVGDEWCRSARDTGQAVAGRSVNGSPASIDALHHADAVLRAAMGAARELND